MSADNFIDKEEKIIFETNCSFSVTENENIVSKNHGKIKLSTESLQIIPKLKEPLFITFRDIVEFYEDDYKLILILTSLEKITIFDLGYKFEDCVRIFSRLYNELMLKDLLMKEALRKTGTDAEFLWLGEKGEIKNNGNCEIRIYETGLVIIPEKGELKRLPFSDFADISDEDYKLSINLESGEKIIFSKLGRDFDSFVKVLSEAINELSLKVQNYLKELIPSATPLVLRKAAQFMKEGRAVRKVDIESISKELWNELEKKIILTDIKEEYEFLKSISIKEKMCIGIKRDLLGDLTGEYIWFLIPLLVPDTKEFANAIAMEAITGEEGGKATYFFKILNRNETDKFKNEEELNKKIDEFIKRINRCMLAINFRREPIYLPDEKLQEPQYEKYRYSISKIQELQELRKLFIGRVIHFSFDNWKNDVISLLDFNIKERDENKKWKKEN